MKDRLDVRYSDVRRVVLCCDCEHYKTFGGVIGCGWCEVTDSATYDDFFCAGGRWKSNSANAPRANFDLKLRLSDAYGKNTHD